MSKNPIDLFRPDLEVLLENDVSFTKVIEERRSIRRFGKKTIDLKQLGEFLFRSARIRSFHPALEKCYEASSRPYPGGGACYELELYPVINTCDGLSSGLYHYDPKDHQLHQLTNRTQEVDLLLEGACRVTGQPDLPQVMIVYAARFHRILWKYESMGYAAILKNVGALYQTMYLVATAMGLASSALGGGDSDLFTTVLGTDYYTETSVGEFILGSRPNDMQSESFIY